jgi:hypothetical protein
MTMKWGWIDTAGAWVIAPQFDEAGDFSEGLAAVAVDEKWGYIDFNGTMIIQPQFGDAEEFSEGYAAVVSEETWQKGYVNMRGEMVIPARFESAWPFRNGIALAVREGENGAGIFDFIDRKGDFLERATHIDKAQKWFSDGFAPTKVGGDGKFDEWEYMDFYGNIISSGKFYQAHAFREGLAHVWTSAVEGVLGYVDRTGKLIITLPKDCDFHEAFSHGRAAVRSAKGWGYIDRKGTFVITPQFQMAASFLEGLAAIKVNDKWGYIDVKGNVIVQPEFEDVRPFHEGMAQVCVNGLWGYINNGGRMVIGPRFNQTGPFKKGIAKAREEIES